MRKIDRQRLSERYRPGERLVDRLGMGIAQVQALADAVRSSCSSGAVSWWTGIDDRARLLITDHLLECIRSVEVNLAEAELHRLELLEAIEDDDLFHAQPVGYARDGGPVLPTIPRRERPDDDLPSAFVALHVVGFFRAISSCLDCLAGGIVGAVGLDSSLLKADFDKVLEEPRTRSTSPPGAGLRAQVIGQIRSRVAESGPEGWFRWTTQMRNLLLHRPRRMQFQQWVPKHDYGGLLDPQGKPVRMAWPRRHLPVEPSLGDSEAFTTDGEWLPLAESMESTLWGVLQSTRATCESTLDELIKFWQLRQSTPDLFAQPSRTVPEAAATERTSFAGYSGKGKFQPDVIVTNPADRERLGTAQNHRKPRGAG